MQGMLRPLLDVERQRDGGHERPDTGPERREEEIAKRGQPKGLELGGEAAHWPSSDANSRRRELRDARKDVSQGDGEELVLLRRADADADRLRGAEAVERSHDDAFALQPLEERAPAADVDEEEVAERRLHGIEPVLAEDLGQPRAA